jgi:hypothetical protein
MPKSGSSFWQAAAPSAFGLLVLAGACQSGGSRYLHGQVRAGGNEFFETVLSNVKESMHSMHISPHTMITMQTASRLTFATLYRIAECCDNSHDTLIVKLATIWHQVRVTISRFLIWVSSRRLYVLTSGLAAARSCSASWSSLFLTWRHRPLTAVLGLSKLRCRSCLTKLIRWPEAAACGLVLRS